MQQPASVYHHWILRDKYKRNKVWIWLRENKISQCLGLWNKKYSSQNSITWNPGALIFLPFHLYSQNKELLKWPSSTLLWMLFLFNVGVIIVKKPFSQFSTYSFERLPPIKIKLTNVRFTHTMELQNSKN